jgi:hypothetical protein
MLDVDNLPSRHNLNKSTVDRREIATSILRTPGVRWNWNMRIHGETLTALQGPLDDLVETDAVG